MENTGDKKATIESLLLNRYKDNGFLLENEIIDVCIEHDLDLLEIDNLCDKLLNQNVIIKDNINKTFTDEEDDDYVDRSHLDYDALLNEIKVQYPNCTALIDEILGILPPQTKEWQSIIKEAQNGNEYAKNRMILMYLRTVMKQAYFFSCHYYCDFEVAFQDGVIGLINAIEKYDVTSPDLFPSYFPLWVRQFMQRYATIRGTILRYPAHYKEQLYSITTEACTVMEDDNFEEALSFVSDDSYDSKCFTNGIAKEHILPYLEIPGEIPYEDSLADDVIREILSGMISHELATLKDREREVLELRYGLIDGNERTLEEIGAIFNVSRERIRQIETKAIKNLSMPSHSNKIKDFL